MTDQKRLATSGDSHTKGLPYIELFEWLRGAEQELQTLSGPVKGVSF